MLRENCCAATFPRLAAAGILGLTLLLPPGGAPAADSTSKIQLLPEGEQAPRFEAVDIDGNPFVLEEELGRGAIFLVFWSIF